MKKLGLFLLVLIVLILTPSMVLAAVGTDTLVGYWKLDEETPGSEIVDSSGDGHLGTPLGTIGPTPSNDKPITSFPNDKSLEFDGNDYIEIADDSNFNGSTFTIAFWVKFDTIDSAHRTLVAKWQVGVKQQYTIQITPDNVIGFWTGDGGTGSSGALTSALSPTEDTWYHITAIASGTNKTLYINGTDNKYTGTGTSPGSSDIELTIGSKKNNSGNYFEFFDGWIDDVRFYNRAVSEQEVDELASGNHTTATWTGSSTTDYENSLNWDINAIPDPYTKVVIADTANDPRLTHSIAVSSLTLNNGSVLSTDCFGINYNDEGALTNNGTLLGCNNQTIIANEPSAPSCNDLKPSTVPNLFQIDTAGTFMTPYFTTTGENTTGYTINYGVDPNADQHGVNFNYNGTDWILSHTIWYLSPNTTYYVKVRALNGCNAGDWSNTMEVKTKNRFANITQFYKMFSPLQTPPTPPPSQPKVAGIETKNSCQYEIKAGDTLWSIAENKWGNGKEYSQILNLNQGLTRTSILRIGQQLKICK